MLIVRTRFLMFDTLFDAAFRHVCLIVKALTPNPMSGGTPLKSTHTCFPPTHPYTIHHNTIFKIKIRKYNLKLILSQ
jgi:hypothetical protein